MAKESIGAIARRRLLGLGYIAVIGSLIALSIAFYNKAFTPTVLVTLHTDHTGNQLVEASDVKERGIIVGSVHSVKSHGDGAVITLGLDPSRTSLIPSNVTAELLPKTLFGEQFVSLVLPAQPGPPIHAGDNIQQDRSQGALETEKVLGDMLPLLTAVQPAELNATLTAMATALHGRGTELGQVLTTFDQYLGQFNPQVPQLVTDLHKLGQLSVNLNNIAPDLLSMLDNLQTSARTLADRQSALDTALTSATDTSNLLTSFLADNRSRLITLVDTSNQVYSLSARYSPSFGCMLAALNELNQKASSGIVDHQIRLSAQLYNPPPGFGAYTPGQEPRLITGYGPNCFGLPHPPVPARTPGPYRCLNDGAPLTNDPCGRTSTNGYDQQAIGSPAENALVNTLIAGSYGAPPDQVPSIATVLAAPALRGSQVSVK